MQGCVGIRWVCALEPGLRQSACIWLDVAQAVVDRCPSAKRKCCLGHAAMTEETHRSTPVDLRSYRLPSSTLFMVIAVLRTMCESIPLSSSSRVTKRLLSRSYPLRSYQASFLRHRFL